MGRSPWSLPPPGPVASATAFSPAGFFTPAERRRALAILRMLRANSYLPTPIMRVALRSAYLRALCFAPLMARPTLLDVERALGDALALRRGLGFNAVARAARDYRFDCLRLSDATVPVTIGWGDCDRIFGVHQAERARGGPAGGTGGDAAPLRARADERRPGPGRRAHPGDHRRRAPHRTTGSVGLRPASRVRKITSHSKNLQAVQVRS